MKRGEVEKERDRDRVIILESENYTYFETLPFPYLTEIDEDRAV